MPLVPDDVLAEFAESLEPAPREVVREVAQSLERDAFLYEDLLRRSVEERSTVSFGEQPRPPYESKIDFAAIAETLDEVERAGRERLLDAITAVRDSLLSKLEKRERLTLGFVSELDLKMLGGVDRALRDMVRDAFARGLGGEAKFKISGPQFSPESALEWLEAKALTSTATTNEAILGSVKQVLLQALKTGELLPETMEKIKNVFAPYVGGEVSDANPHRLETIVRTNATEAFNQGRLVEGRNNSLVVAFEYSAIMDARTTPICAALDGKVFRKGDPALDRVIPPNHYNCRSVLVPILADENIEQLDLATSEEVGKVLDLMTPGFGGAVTK